MHVLRILVGSGSRSHVLHVDSIITFKPAKDSGSNFLNLEANEDLTTFTSTSSVRITILVRHVTINLFNLSIKTVCKLTCLSSACDRCLSNFYQTTDSQHYRWLWHYLCN